MENKHSSDAILDNFFSITQNLYKEMSKSDNDSSNDHAEIYRLLTDLGRTLVDADRASFWKWDKRNHTLWTTAAVGEGRITIPEGTGLVGKALMEKRAIVTNDPYNCPDFNSSVDKKTGYVTNSILVMPISNCKGEFIGAYQAINKLSGKGFDIEEDVKRLSLAAFICGITLESDSFLEDSLHDKLTELKNRAGFYSDYTKVYEEILTDTSADRNVSLIICDIDFFKKVNDEFGHEAGDRVLVHMASVLKNTVRESDYVIRWGGEEFLIIMPGCAIDNAKKIAEKLREKVETSDNGVCRRTISLGVAEYTGGDYISTVKNADVALYDAKNSGRNKVVVYTPKA